MQKNSPGKIDEIVNMQEQLFQIKAVWEQHDKLSKKIAEKQQENIQIKKRLRTLEKQLSEEENFLMQLKAQYQKTMQLQMAEQLRENLRDGEPCLVCGSIHWNKEAILSEHATHVRQVEELEKEIEKNESIFYERKNEYMILNNAMAQNNVEITQSEEEKKKLNQEFLQISVQEAETTYFEKKQKIYHYEQKEKEIREKKEKLLEESNYVIVQLGNIQGEKKALEKQKETQLLERQQMEKHLEKTLEQLQVKRIKTKCDNFKKQRDEIFEMEQELEQCTKKLESIRDDMKQLQELEKQISVQKYEVQLQIQTLEEQEKSLLARKKESSDRIEKKIQNSRKRYSAEEENLDKWLEQTIKIQGDIEGNYKSKKYEKEKIDCELEQIINLQREEEGKETILEDSYIKANQALRESLEKQQFASVELVRLAEREDKIMDNMQKEIKQYENQSHMVEEKIKEVLCKLNGECVLEDKWEELCNDLDVLKKQKKILEEQHVTMRNTVNEIKKKQKELDVLMFKMEEVEHQMAVVDELERLFRGKKFVEYVAAERLHYISQEATKCLKEISNGMYGIEVNENGKFMIRDYKNGGALRDAATLSGGETFLASLALALSLSAEIQLKGNAPLELFFLDEGFGTLDDELLELVIESLEKLQNERLHIGIISHVETIKNRVPIKLMLTPAQAGLGGSKVRIEKS